MKNYGYHLFKAEIANAARAAADAGAFLRDASESSWRFRISKQCRQN